MKHVAWVAENGPSRHARDAGVPAGSRIAHRTLAGLLAFNGIGALFGGVGLLTGTLGMPLSLLDGTVFDSYMIPGWILLIIVGGSSTLASVMVWKNLRNAGEAAIVAGLILLGWIVTEFVLIPEGWAFQSIYILIGLAILLLGIKAYTSATPSGMQ
jgi:hypothetical protein